MRIRNQFIISTAVFSIVFIIVTTSVIVTNQQIALLDQKQEISASIERGADELNTFSSQYFLYQKTDQLTFWKSSLASISDNLSNLNLENSEQQTLANNTKNTLGALSATFNNLVIFLETAPRNISVRIIPEFQNYWDQMITEHQNLSLSASELSQSLRIQADQLRLTNVELVVTLLGLFGAFFFTNYIITYRRTLKSISNLQTGINTIGLGNLDHSISEDKNNEIGELSSSFNQMTTNLKNVTASKKELEKEIAERKKAEKSLMESEQRLRFHAENIPLAVVEWNESFIVTRWAGEAQKMFGWNASEAIGKPIMDLNLIYKPDITIVEKTMGKLTSGQTQVVSSNRNIKKNGEVIYCTWYNSALLDKNGKMVSVFSFVEDYTARMIAEKALEETNRNLEKLVEERTRQLKDSERLAAIGATAGMVGHDIRNPLQAITSDVYLAKTDLTSIPESEEKKSVQESLTEIENNVSYINKIVSDLQDFARPLTPKIEEINLEKTINYILAQISIPENITVTHSIRKDFPKLKADESYIQRIVINLTNNAIQAMPKGGKLTINAARITQKAIISVEDTGEGIPENMRSKLFMPLMTTKSKGQGFGLAVVKRFTEGLGGTVTFESEVGKGTKFTIELPL
jgi:PAS domain S-box-containing protein